QKHEYAYNNGLLSEYSISKVVNGNWVNMEKQEYAYTGNNVTSTVLYLWKNNLWEVQGRHLINFDVNNNKTSDEWQYWETATASFRSASRKVWTYNSYDQPLSYFSEKY